MFLLGGLQIDSLDDRSKFKLRNVCVSLDVCDKMMKVCVNLKIRMEVYVIHSRRNSSALMHAKPSFFFSFLMKEEILKPENTKNAQSKHNNRIPIKPNSVKELSNLFAYQIKTTP